MKKALEVRYSWVPPCPGCGKNDSVIKTSGDTWWKCTKCNIKFNK